ncbi:hypothetical protein [Phaeocystidibacter marisrubri]|uniref:Uncharacterized protein n=1 Tax=Phaeocystidibacter marisrubri TaxID=1577780 RepID=A0A6L3ZC78_9FLAO|nr:hypothetical protein [Phaeocystidibacter marisrubri]KAB2815016.1 hypothetical protein F8C82_14635 [Phaeocystidibacter marisrubri]GGH78057.1 hypothetical protein GCM10011318_28760 [Phaeocystidibacter marisrubri]
MNWKELKAFCNELPEAELEKKVIIWREDEAISQLEVMRLDEDYFIDPEEPEYGCFRDSELEDMIDEEFHPNGREDFKKVYDKGTPMISEKL